jgi:hypothetical protein
MKMSLQAVLFRSDVWDIPQSKSWLYEHSINQIKPVHETKQYLWYRIQEPVKGAKYYSRFIDKEKTIMFVFQSVKEGAGVISEIQRYLNGLKMAWAGTRTNLKPIVRQFLQGYGDKEISHLDVCRRPLGKTYNSALQGVRTVSDMGKLPYDKVFHLFFIVSFSDGTHWRFEKNESINVVKYTESDTDEKVNVPIDRGLTLNSMVKNTIDKVGAKRFFHYSAFSTNCQMWVYDMLTANDLEDDDLRQFIIQDVSDLVPSWGKKIAQWATDTKNRIDTVREGEGFKSRYD